MLNTLTNDRYTLSAKDTKKDEQTRRIELSSFPDMSGGLPKELVLAVGARVILTKNIDVTDGLVNSASGVVTGFLPIPLPDDASFNLKYVLIKFDDERDGRKKRLESRSILPDDISTPIQTVESPIHIGHSNKVTSKRIQFPLVHAWAVTIHKEQGKTEETLVLSCKGNFNAGQFYTAVSRTKELDGLFILDKVTPQKIKVNIKSLTEIRRMRTDSVFCPPLVATETMSTETFLKINVFNINSLIPHYESLMKDNFVQMAHMTCLVETWLKQTDTHPDVPSFEVIRTDRKQGHIKRHGGLLTYIHEEIYFITQRPVSNVDLEYQLSIFAPAENKSIRFAFLLVYINPKTDTDKLMCDLERLVSALPTSIPAIVTVDFNVDLLKPNSVVTKLKNLMKYYNLHQYISQPTHRKGGLLDHFYTNIRTPNIVAHTIPTYYSDHLMISVAIPKRFLC